MPEFRYKAIDREAVSHHDSIEAPTMAEAVAALQARDLDVHSIEALNGSGGFPPPTVAGTSHPARGSFGSWPGRAPHAEPLAPPPPPPPRPLPPKVTGAPGGYVLLIVGGLFAGVASIFVIVGLAVVASGDRGGWAMALFPLIHLTVGVGMIWYALHHRLRRRRLATEGLVTVAQVDHVGLDHSTKVNGRNPFKVEYSFEVGGTSYRGKRSSFNRALTAHLPDDTIWVLYDGDDPGVNMEWPPL